MQMFSIQSLYQGINYLDMILDDGIVLDFPKGKTRPTECCLAQNTECSLLYFFICSPHCHSIILYAPIHPSHHTDTQTHTCMHAHAHMCMHTQLHHLISVGTMCITLCA